MARKETGSGGTVKNVVLKRIFRDRKSSKKEKKVKAEQRKKLLRPETLIKYHKIREHAERIAISSLLKIEDSVADENTVVFAFRITDRKRTPPRFERLLGLIRLGQVHVGAFMRLKKPIFKILQFLKLHVFWGTPSLKTIRDMIYKHGYCKVDDQVVPLSNNLIIENALGYLGIVCMEDLVHEISTSGKNFCQVSKFLCPFKLHPNPKLLANVHGDRKDDINTLLSSMN